MKANTHPSLYTRWGREVPRENPLPEYPRPQLVRKAWQSLNGVWRYAITNGANAIPNFANGEIIVPFSPESVLSEALISPETSDTLWYWRSFTLDIAAHSRLLLHFGAVDQCCSVYLNGKEIGTHQGGYWPFSLELTEYANNGSNLLCISVADADDNELYAYGKQKQKRGGIWYTPTSGIWQSVWLEEVPMEYISQVKITPLYDESKVHFEIFGNFSASTAYTISIKDENNIIIKSEYNSRNFCVEIPHFKSWSPDSPFLYGAVITAGQDSVESYFGMRKFSIDSDSLGYKRLMLNNKPIFHTGLLDQGYWSDGIYTAPSDDAIISELTQIKALGFNMLRKHIKIEPLRWYYHCDRLGIMVWQDFVSGGKPYSPLVTQLLPFFNIHLKDDNYSAFGRQSAESRKIYEEDMHSTISLLYNTVSLAVWVPFNEGWGQFNSAYITDKIKSLDNTRSVDSASGWHDNGAGDFCSKHIYYKKYRIKKDKQNRVQALTEFGGYSYAVSGHMYGNKLFGYRMFKSEKALTEGFLRLYENEVIKNVSKGLCAAIYTQVSDVEDEINGIFTYDRSRIKLSGHTVQEINQALKSSLK